MNKLKWIFPCIPILLIVGIVVFTHVRQSGFKDGYERGMKHYLAYHRCFEPPSTPWDELPPQAWRDRAWHFVDEGPKDSTHRPKGSSFIPGCEFVMAADNLSQKSAQ